MTEKPMRQQDLSILLELLERAARVEQKLDSMIASIPCDKHSSRISALEQKIWMALGGLGVVTAVGGAALAKLPAILQILSNGATP